MSEIVLDLQALTRRFDTFTAVDAVTLSVNTGEIFGLLGSNGAGKTTTIKMLTTLLPPSSGQARVAGFSITTQAGDVRRAIGYVQEAVSVDGSLTGYENLLIFAKLYDLPRCDQQARITEALEFMGLAVDGGRLVGEYSGGMFAGAVIDQGMHERARLPASMVDLRVLSSLLTTGILASTFTRGPRFGRFPLLRASSMPVVEVWNRSLE